jgi:hypothetical protein
MNPDISLTEAVDVLWDKHGPISIVEKLLIRTAWNSRHAAMDEQEQIGKAANALTDAINALKAWQTIAEQK